MKIPIKHIDQVTPEWLTAALVESGHLQQGKVRALSWDQSRVEGFTSERYHLELVYTENVPKSAPDHLFLKIGTLGSFEFCKKEIEFYRLAEEFQTDLSLLTCYNSAISLDSKHSHLLLQDLSKTHFTPNFSRSRHDPKAPFPLTRSEIEGAIECLATVHASWWNSPRLMHEIGDRPSEETSRQFFKKDIKEFMVFMFDTLGEQFPSKKRLVYESALSSYPDLYWKYINEGAPLTIRHADAHLGNFMFPVDPDKDRTILLDWQSWGVDIGITDITHLIALNMHPGQRQVMERDLLVHYYNQLVKKGVTGYSWDECWFGYRLQVLWMLFLPIFWFSMKLPLDHCWPFMEKGFAAFQDLQCSEFLVDAA